jgi:imidazolonepropionase-like amidohydrolase
MLSLARRLVSPLTFLSGAASSGRLHCSGRLPFLTGALALAGSLPSQGQPAAPPQPTLALVVGTIHPVAGPAITDGVILLAGERILQLGPRGRVAIPAGVAVQTYPGAHAYPGLVDAHAQICLPEGGSTEVDAGTNALAALDPTARNAGQSLAAGITTAHVTVAAAGRWLGQGALVQPRELGCLPLTPTTDGAVHMRLTTAAGLHPVARLKELADLGRPFEEATAHVKRVAKHKEALAQYEKDWAAYLEARKGKAAAKPAAAPAAAEGDAKPEDKAGEKPTEAKPAEAKRPTYPTAPTADPAKAALAAIADGKLRLRIEAERRDELRAALRLIAELKLDRATLLGASDALAIADELARAGVGVILTPTGLPVEVDGEPVAPHLAAELHKRGVPLAIASGDAERARALPLLAAACVGAGLDPDVAVRALTLTPAELLGIAQHVGSLEPGKRADILLTSAPLLQSDARVLRVLIAGQTVHQGR